MSRSKLTAKKREAFLAQLREGASVTKACELAVVPKGTIYEWRSKDSCFALAMDEAQEAGLDRLEDEARRRAYEGVTEPVGWHQGNPGGYVQRYSDTLMIFLLKGGRPEKYRERMEHSGEVVSRVVIAGVSLPAQPEPPKE